MRQKKGSSKLCFEAFCGPSGTYWVILAQMRFSKVESDSIGVDCGAEQFSKYFSNKPKNSHGSLFTPQNTIHYLVQVPWDKRNIGQNSVWGPFLTRLVHSRYFGSVKRYKRQNELPLGKIGDQKRSGKLSKKLKTLLEIPMYPQNL